MNQVPIQAILLAAGVIVLIMFIIPRLQLSEKTVRNYRLVAVWAGFLFLSYDFYIKQKPISYIVFFLFAAGIYTYAIVQAKKKSSE